MVVVQDVRGRYTSEGEWYTFKHEIDDGYDTVEWAAALPHSNGKVGMFGGSYVGATQMLAAIGHPPHLAGICPVVTASNYHENWTYQGGAFEQWFNESWTSGLAQDTVQPPHPRRHQRRASAIRFCPSTHYPDVQYQAQSPAAHRLTHELAPYFLDWLAHPTYDSYWKQWSIEENYQNIQVPALTIAAWYDIFQGGSLRNYMGMREHAGNETARNGQRLSGHHRRPRRRRPQDRRRRFRRGRRGLRRKRDHPRLVRLSLPRQAEPVRRRRTSGTHFRDGQKRVARRSRPGRWRARNRPAIFLQLRAAKPTALRAMALLSTAAAAQQCARHVHLRSGQSRCPRSAARSAAIRSICAAGPRDQKDVEARSDVLVYSTPALDEDIEVTGPVTLDLFAKSSAVDTDFTAKLVDVWPNGFAQNLTEGILRASFRESTLGEPKPITPGQVYEYKIDLWSTSNVFLKGHRIRLEVSQQQLPALRPQSEHRQSAPHRRAVS